MYFRTVQELTPVNVTFTTQELVSSGDALTPPTYKDVFQTRVDYQMKERQVPVSTLADEVYQDEGEDNCLDFACTALAELDAQGVDISEFEVVIFENPDPNEPGHVGLVRDGRFFDSSGEHDFAEWQAEHPELVLLTANDGTLPAGDEFLRIMTIPPGEERDLELERAGLADIANTEVALFGLVVLGLVAVVALAGCTSGSDEPRVFTDHAQLIEALQNGESLAGAVFDFPVDGRELFEAGVSLRNTDLSGATFNYGVTYNDWDYNLDGAQLEGANFEGDTRAWFFGADLRGATFNGTVSNTNFLYADLSGADFSGATVTGTTFSFSTIDGSTQLPWDCADCAFTGIPGGTPVLDPVVVNTPEILFSLTGTNDPAQQEIIIRQMAADQTLYGELDALLPGAFDRALPPTWRSTLYDGIRLAGEAEGTVKSFIFDDVTNTWTSGVYDYNAYRPDGGPTLSWLYEDLDSVPLVMPSLTGLINDTLADMLLSEEPATLDDPSGGRVTAGNFQFAFNWGAASTVDEYVNNSIANLGQPHGFNGEDRTRADIMVPAEILAHARTRLSGDDLTAFDAIASDNIVSAQDLVDAGLFDAVLRAAWDLYR